MVAIGLVRQEIINAQKDVKNERNKYDLGVSEINFYSTNIPITNDIDKGYYSYSGDCNISDALSISVSKWMAITGSNATTHRAIANLTFPDMSINSSVSFTFYTRTYGGLSNWTFAIYDVNDTLLVLHYNNYSIDEADYNIKTETIACNLINESNYNGCYLEVNGTWFSGTYTETYAYDCDITMLSINYEYIDNIITNRITSTKTKTKRRTIYVDPKLFDIILTYAPYVGLALSVIIGVYYKEKLKHKNSKSSIFKKVRDIFS
jgi:hypothetical protein